MTDPQLFRGEQIHPRCETCGFLLSRDGKCAMGPHEEESA